MDQDAAPDAANASELAAFDERVDRFARRAEEGRGFVDREEERQGWKRSGVHAGTAVRGARGGRRVSGSSSTSRGRGKLDDGEGLADWVGARKRGRRGRRSLSRLCGFTHGSAQALAVAVGARCERASGERGGVRLGVRSAADERRDPLERDASREVRREPWADGHLSALAAVTTVGDAARERGARRLGRRDARGEFLFARLGLAGGIRARLGDDLARQLHCFFIERHGDLLRDHP